MRCSFICILLLLYTCKTTMSRMVEIKLLLYMYELLADDIIHINGPLLFFVDKHGLLRKNNKGYTTNNVSSQNQSPPMERHFMHREQPPHYQHSGHNLPTAHEITPSNRSVRSYIINRQ